MIVATAGHVDHGKTALVKALTGTDTDTLEEEKRRGLTIIPGFAYCDLPIDELSTFGPSTDNRETPETPDSERESMRIGFVDVPGHHQFIHNMLSGIAGIDAVLLVIAADEGIMPQTIEHLRIMDLLHIENGLFVITKTDRADPVQLATLDNDLRAFSRGTFMADKPVIHTAAMTGAGMDELLKNLTGLAARLPQRSRNGNFRMAIDRAFTLKGIGVVVTGTVHAGHIRINDALALAPTGNRTRVRGIFSDNRRASEAAAGHRCAINLGSIELSQIHRGDWLTTSDATGGTTRVDVHLEFATDVSHRIRHWTPVHVFHGASHVTGRVALLEDRKPDAHSMQLAQLVLDRPVVAVHGDVCILRNQASDETLAGAVVLDICAPKRGRARPARLRQLRRMQTDTARECLCELLANESAGVALEPFRLNWNLTPTEAETLYRDCGMVIIETDDGRYGVHPDRIQDLRDEIRLRINRWHDNRPYADGIRLNELHAGLEENIYPPLLEAALRTSVQQGEICQSGPFYHSPDFTPQLRDEEGALWETVCRTLREAGDRPPTTGELAASIDMDSGPVIAALKQATRAGLAVPVEPNRYFLPDTLQDLARLLAQMSAIAPDGLVTTGAFRDASGLGRNLAIAVLEHFDKVKLTRRIGNARRLSKSIE
jgi:selenocysteine-specific elongation factor